jgi:glutamine phosphoribosylpyrophosphate amidotransferase
MDTHDPKNLVAAQMSLDELATMIGADSIGYNTPARIQEAADEAAKKRGLVDRAAKLCTSCFTGDYAARPPASVLLGMPAVREAFAGVGTPKVTA